MEHWLPVTGYEGLYKVSDHGNVWSIKANRLRKQFISLDGRPFVGIWKNAKLTNFRVHTLVLTAFISPRPDKMECCHNDGNPLNNHLTNLRWDTRIANQADKIKHGTTNRGERCANAKLTKKQVAAIRLDTRLQREIAADYGVLQNTISRIKSGARWAHD